MNNRIIRFFLMVLLYSTFASMLSLKARAFNKNHLEALQRGVASWNSMRADHNEFLPDLSGADLKGKNLRWVDLHNANLSGTILSQSDLSNANMKNALLENAHLNSSVLIKANFEGASLCGADLESAVLDGADFFHAVLKKAVLKKADCSNVNMMKSDLQECNFREATLVHANLTGSDLRGSYLWRVNLSRAMLTGAQVSESTILNTGRFASKAWAEEHAAVMVVEHPLSSSANTVSVDEKRSGIVFPPPHDDRRMTERPIQESNISKSKERIVAQNIWSHADGTVHGAYDRTQYDQLKSNVFDWNTMRKQERSMSIHLEEAPLDHKNLRYADLNHALLFAASFRSSDVSNCDLRFADLRKCDFQEADLERADLGCADLRGATLWRANIDRARLTGATVSNKTILDSGKNATLESAGRLGLIFTAE